jgi:uncharacterized protein (DUF736 family)
MPAVAAQAKSATEYLSPAVNAPQVATALVSRVFKDKNHGGLEIFG